MGALVEVAITNVADRRMIGVTSSPAAVAAGMLRDNVATELGELFKERQALPLLFWQEQPAHIKSDVLDSLPMLSRVLTLL